MVAVSYEWWPLTRGSKYSDLSEKLTFCYFIKLPAEERCRNRTFDCTCHINIVTLEFARIDQAWRLWLTSSRVPLELNRWQTAPHSLREPVDHLQRTLSPSESSAGIAIVFEQPCWCRTMGASAEIGDELIFPLSCLLVRLTVVDRNQFPFPPFANEIQQQSE